MLTTQQITDKIEARRNADRMVVTNSRCGKTYYQYHMQDENGPTIHTSFHLSAKSAYKAATRIARRRRWQANRHSRIINIVQHSHKVFSTKKINLNSAFIFELARCRSISYSEVWESIEYSLELAEQCVCSRRSFVHGIIKRISDPVYKSSASDNKKKYLPEARNRLYVVNAEVKYFQAMLRRCNELRRDQDS